MNTIIKIFVGILVLGVLGTFSWGVSYVVSDSENYEKLKFTFNKICILILVTVLVAMGLIQGIPSSIFYGVIFLSITIVAMVTKLVPNYEYNQMAFGSILLVILFSVFIVVSGAEIKYALIRALICGLALNTLCSL